MNQETYAGQMPHIIETAAAAGFQGLEAEICMARPLLRPTGGGTGAANAASHGVRRPGSPSTLGAQLPNPGGGRAHGPGHRVSEAFSICPSDGFPHAGANPRGSGDVLEARRRCLIACMDAVANQAAEAGIITCYHPNSAPNSLFRTREDYKVLLDLLERTNIGYAPDIGHIVNGGMDALEILKESRNKVRHVHFKDRDGEGRWTVMGKGVIDYPAIVRYLEDTGYGGWIMVEDESPDAALDSDGVVRQDGIYMKQFQGSESI